MPALPLNFSQPERMSASAWSNVRPWYFDWTSPP